MTYNNLITEAPRRGITARQAYFNTGNGDVEMGTGLFSIGNGKWDGLFFQIQNINK